jgi:hypothetical protein
LPLPGGSQKESVFVPGDEGPGSQIKDQAAIHLFVEVEIEVVEGLERIAELGLLASPLQQAFGAAREFVGDQTGDQILGAMDSA